VLTLLKIVKILETFAFGVCTLGVTSPNEKKLQAIGTMSKEGGTL
jgi:hypothetical protein